MADCIDSCPYKEIIEDLRVSDKNNRGDIIEIKLSQKEMQGDMKLMSSDLSHAVDLIKSIQMATEELKNKPSKKMDAVSISIMSGTIMLVIGAIVTAIIKLL